MIKTNRLNYFFITITVLVLGLLSRKIEGIPSYFGDALYAILIYFGFRFVFINLSLKKNTAFALLFCFCIEFQQLYHASWIVNLRNTFLGHSILGQGFLWSDLLCYTIGVFVAFALDDKLTNNMLFKIR